VRRIGKLIYIIGVVLCVTVFSSSSTTAQTYDCGTYSAGDYSQECLDESAPSEEQTSFPTEQNIETDSSLTSDGQEATDDVKAQTEDEDSTRKTMSYWWIIGAAILIVLIGLAAVIYYRRHHSQGV
jgi:hypothetical protein